MSRLKIKLFIWFIGSSHSLSHPAPYVSFVKNNLTISLRCISLSILYLMRRFYESIISGKELNPDCFLNFPQSLFCRELNLLI